jgi:hypothetical protein
MPFKKVNARVDLIDQTTARRKLMNGADSAIGNGLIAAIKIVNDIAAGHHRLGLILPVSFFYLLLNFSLAFCQFFADISFHSKCSFLFSGYCSDKHIIH